MLDLDKAIMALDSSANCSHRRCEVCYKLYGVEKCPSINNNDQLHEIIRILKKAREKFWDNPIVTEEDFVNLFGE